MILGDLPTQRRTQQTPPPNRRGSQLRLVALMVGVLLSFTIIGQRLYVLQVERQGEFLSQIQDTSIYVRRLPATRGLIYDRTGEPLVRNAPLYQVTILPYKQPQNLNRIEQRIQRADIYNRLARLINQPEITAGDIYTKVYNAQQDNIAYEPVIVAENVPRETALYIQELSYQMPGVAVQETGTRTYPYKDLLSQILGYAQKVPAEQAENYPAEIYDIENDRVGYAGVEKIAEVDLRGKKGRVQEVRDASGEVVDIVGTPISPTNGNSVYLTIDLRLQKIISDALIPIMKIRNSPRAAVVVLDPNNGDILGMVSVPAYDNNQFANGITQKELDVLRNDLHKPLLNHATQEAPPPGSTFKIVTAAALLQEGYVTPETVINDPGVFELPGDISRRQFVCWIYFNGGSHGPQTVSDALRNSCNTFFRKAVGGYAPEGITSMGPDLLAKWTNQFGIGEANKLQLAYITGIAPTPNYLQRTFGVPWFTGDSYNAAIGQGYVAATPLEMANVIAAVANGGTLYDPQIIKEVRDSNGVVVSTTQPSVIRQLPLSPENMALLRQSLRDVVSIEKRGTAIESSLEPFGFEFSGKTGTAEFCDQEAVTAGICYVGIKNLPSHAWFVAYAPSENPKIAIAVYIWNGGQGSGVAAPVAQRIINGYFNLGIPEDKLKKVTSDRDLTAE